MKKDQATRPNSPLPTRRRLPMAIWALGLGSLLMDTSSELVHALSPVLLVNMLGASVVAVGMIEGVAEGAAAVTKVFAGAISDYFRRRKTLIVLGYALAALAKPLFPLATSASWIFAARFIDRMSKGIRDAPRDALVADITGQTQRGAAYGLRQALDSVGAVLGPILAVLLMLYFSGGIRAAMWVAVIPAVLAVLVLVFLLREPEQKQAVTREPPDWGKVRELSGRYWLIVAVGAIFTAARFSDSFLVLRARDIGLSASYAPIIMVVLSCVYAAGSYPAGAASDRIHPRTLLLIGLGFLIAANIVLAVGRSIVPLFAGGILWGLHLAFIQGVFAKIVADFVPPDLRATGFGIFDLARGVGFVIANVVAGWWWRTSGPSAAFFSAAAFASIAGIGLSAATRHRS
ncbi:MAG: MFS transporter [Chthoniobacterales bacterium]